MTNKGDNEINDMPETLFINKNAAEMIQFDEIDGGTEFSYTLTVTIADKDKIIEGLYQNSKSQTQTAEALIKKCRARDKTICGLAEALDKVMKTTAGGSEPWCAANKALSDNATQIKEAKDNA